MVQIDIIVPQDSPTPWVTLIMVVQKSGKIRVCFDPTKLNKAVLWSPYTNKAVKQVVTKTARSQ